MSGLITYKQIIENLNKNQVVLSELFSGNALDNLAASNTESNALQSEVEFILKSLNFQRLVCLKVLRDTKIIDHLKDASFGEYEASFMQYFIEYCKALQVIRENGTGGYTLSEVYNKPQYFELDKLVYDIETNNILLGAPIEDEVVTSFGFIYILIQINNGRKISSEICELFGVTDEWISKIKETGLNYLVLLAEYLYEIRLMNMKSKFNFSKSEEFFTLLGKISFEQFTKMQFQFLINELNRAEMPIKSVMDVGCGYGNYIDALCQIDSIDSIIGIERQNSIYVSSLLKYASNPVVQIFNEDARFFDIRTKVDLVMFNYMLFYLPYDDKVKLFKNICNYLTPNGYILVTQYYPNVHDIQKSLAHLKNDFDIETQIGMQLGNIMQHGELLLNESLLEFNQVETWETFLKLCDEVGLKITYLEKAERYYYSYFVVLQKN